MRVNILNLAAYDVTHIEETEHDCHITADTINPPTACPHCQSDYLVGFGRRGQMVWDLPMHAKRVGIFINTNRFLCRACTKIFYEALPDVDEKRA